jgi:hypothetical protein
MKIIAKIAIMGDKSKPPKLTGSLLRMPYKTGSVEA